MSLLSVEGAGGSHANILNISRLYCEGDGQTDWLGHFPPPSQEGRLQPNNYQANSYIERRTISVVFNLNTYLLLSAFLPSLAQLRYRNWVEVVLAGGKLFRRADIENGRVLSI